MFYCDPCARKNDWPNWMGFRSFGACEVCGEVAECYDCPSRNLPLPKTDTGESASALGEGEG